MLKNPRDYLVKKKEQKKAVCHFNINNLEMLKSVTRAAGKSNQATYLAVTETALTYAGFDYLVSLIKTAAKLTNVDLFLHLDHGKSMKTIKDAIEAGFTSIMYDGSSLPYEENVRETKKVKNMIGAKGVALEAELGHVGRKGDDSEILTQPEEARSFSRETKIDSLAVAVGTVHGSVEDLQLDYERLKRINNKVKVPLVIHGASGLSAKQIKNLIENGGTKFNFDSDIRLAFMSGFKRHIDEIDPRRPLRAAMKEMEETIKEKIKFVN